MNNEIPKKERRYQISVYIDQSQLEVIDAKTKEENKSISEIVRDLIDTGLDSALSEEIKFCDCCKKDIIIMDKSTFVGIQETWHNRDYNLSLHNCPTCGATKTKKISK